MSLRRGRHLTKGRTERVVVAMTRRTCGKCGHRRKVYRMVTMAIEPLEGPCVEMAPIFLCRECATIGVGFAAEAFCDLALELKRRD